MAWVPGSRSKFGNWTSVPSLYSWNIAECDVKPQTTTTTTNIRGFEKAEGPRLNRHTKHKQIRSRNFHRHLEWISPLLKHNDTNCQRPRNDRNFDKNKSTFIKMNASCTKCAIMKRWWIKLAKIAMDKRQTILLTPDAYGGYPEVIACENCDFDGVAMTMFSNTSTLLKAPW